MTTAGGRAPVLRPLDGAADIDGLHDGIARAPCPAGLPWRSAITVRTAVRSCVGGADDRDVVGEGDDRHAVAARERVDVPQRDGLRGCKPRRQRVSRGHRAGHVEDEHDGGFLPLHRDRRVGRAKPTRSSVTPTSRRATGRCRRHGAGRLVMFGSRPARPRRTPAGRAAGRATGSRRPRPAPRAGRRAGPARRSSPCPTPPAQEAGQRPQPVALGRERNVPHARGGERGDERAALVGGDGREPLAQAAIARVDAQLAPGLRIDEPQLADIGELLLARIANLDRERRRGALRAAAAAAASRSARGSRRRRRPERAASSPGRRARAPRAACPLPAGGRSRSRRSVSRSARRPCRGRSTTRLGSERDRAEPVPAPRRRVADRDRNALGDVRLPPVGRSERHRRRRIEHEPGDEHALGQLDAHVRLAGAGGHVPFDPADVVARLVRTDLPELAADSRERRAIVAGQQAVDAPADRQLERAQRRRRERAGPGLLGGAKRGERVVGHSDGVCAAEVDLRRRHGGQHLVEDRVRRDLLRERAVGEHEPVAERVADERVDVARDARSRARGSTRAPARPRRG